MSPRFADGATLGRYRLLRAIGAGAMGEVYLAEDPHIERRLAIKTLLLGSGEGAEESELRARLMREAKAAGRISHPHVVTLFDVGESQGVLYLAFEYVGGSDLDSRMSRPPPLSLGEVLRIGRQAAEGLAAAHREGIVHRDIKPSNLMLDAAGQVKISDFGIAKVLGQETELTMTGSVIGSPHYLSPEQVRGEALDGRSDLFSLGVVLYQLLSGRRPFEADTLTTLVYQILERDAVDIGRHRPGLPPRLEAVIGRLLAKDRNRRFASADELAAELRTLERELPERVLATTAALSEDLQSTRRLAEEESGTPPPPPLPPPPAAASAPSAVAAQPSAKRAVPVPLLAGLGGLLLVVAAALGYWWMERRSGAVGDLANPAPHPAAVAESADDGRREAPASTATPGSAAAIGDGEPANPASTTDPAVQPVVEDSSRGAVPGPTPQGAPPSLEPTPRPSPTASAPIPRPTPTRPQPTPTPASTPAPTPTPTPTPEPDAWAQIDIDREVVSGLSLAFEVQPDDAVVQLMSRGDRRFTQLGRVAEWNPKEKEGRAYVLPEPGEYLVRLRSPGRVDQVIYLDATAGGNRQTAIVAQLRRQDAEDVHRGDLEHFVVREAVAFRVEPEAAGALAEIWVGDRRMGPASQYPGGLRGERWLTLGVGSHRVSVRAEGYRRRDLLVEVRADAEDRRERISLRLVVER